MKACLYCGTNLDNHVERCPVCGSPEFIPEDEIKKENEMLRRDEEAYHKVAKQRQFDRRVLPICVTIVAMIIIIVVLDSVITRANDVKSSFIYGTECYDQGLLPEAIEELGRVPSNSKYFESAQKMIDDATEEYVSDVENQADTYLRDGKLASAVKVLKQAVDILPCEDDLQTKFSTNAEKYRSQVIEKANKEIDQNGYDKAMKTLRSAQMVLEDDNVLDNTIEEFLEYAPYELSEEEPYEVNCYAEVGKYEKNNYGYIYDQDVFSPNSTYEEGVVRYYIGQEYSVLRGTVFVPWDSRNVRLDELYDSEDQTQIAIYGDGKKLCSLKKIIGTDKPYNFKIDIDGVEFLEIRLFGGYFDPTMCITNLSVATR